MWSELIDGGKVKYYERYTDPLTLKNKRVSITLTGSDTAANRKMAVNALTAKIDKAQDISLMQDKDITLNALFAAYTDYQYLTVKASTYERNQRTLTKLCRKLGNDAVVNNLTVAYVNKKLLTLSDNPVTLNEYISRLKAMLRWGYNNEYFDNTFFQRLHNFNVKETKRERIKDKFLEPDEVNKLLAEMTQDNWKYVTRFMLLTGCRIGEVIALDVDDIKDGYITINKTFDPINKIVTSPKTMTSNRSVYIQPELAKLIREYKQWRRIQDVMLGCRSSYIFHDNAGELISYYAYEKYIREVAERAIGRTITTHVLRHTHASLLLADGVPIDTISRRLGHENSKITRQVYLHVTKKLQEFDNDIIKSAKLL